MDKRIPYIYIYLAIKRNLFKLHIPIDLFKFSLLSICTNMHTNRILNEYLQWICSIYESNRTHLHNIHLVNMKTYPSIQPTDKWVCNSFANTRNVILACSCRITDRSKNVWLAIKLQEFFNSNLHVRTLALFFALPHLLKLTTILKSIYNNATWLRIPHNIFQLQCMFMVNFKKGS